MDFLFKKLPLNDINGKYILIILVCRVNNHNNLKALSAIKALGLNPSYSKTCRGAGVLGAFAAAAGESGGPGLSSPHQQLLKSQGNV